MPPLTKPILLLCLALVFGNALGAPHEQGFFARGSEGWFFYRDPPPALPPAEQEPKQDPPPPTPQVAPTVQSAVAPLSAQWFRENLTRYRDAAIDNPTPENVAAYYYLQRIALDKSTRFAAVAARVVQGDPALDEVTKRPTATFGANLVNREAGDARDALLAKIARQAGVWFFFRSDCPYCEAQAPLLSLLEKRYGFSILPVSIDGRGLPSGLFAEYQIDRGQATALGVVSTPALFLARPAPQAVAPVAQGLLSLAQLQERLVLAAVKAGWISEEDLRRTKPIMADTSLDPSLLSGPLPEDPAALLARLRAMTHAPSP